MGSDSERVTARIGRKRYRPRPLGPTSSLHERNNSGLQHPQNSVVGPGLKTSKCRVVTFLDCKAQIVRLYPVLVFKIVECSVGWEMLRWWQAELVNVNTSVMDDTSKL